MKWYSHLVPMKPSQSPQSFYFENFANSLLSNDDLDDGEPISTYMVSILEANYEGIAFIWEWEVTNVQEHLSKEQQDKLHDALDGFLLQTWHLPTQANAPQTQA
jgi:hypothetical protein